MWKNWFNRIRELWLDRPLAPGTHVDRWRIERMLGEGSYGIAYLAFDEEMRRKAVVKQFRRSRSGDDRGRALLDGEKRVLLSLRHPRIPQVLGEVIDGSGSFLILSYIPGPTVEQLLFEHRTVFPVRESVILVRKLAHIVRELHQRGIVHRDVRIPNVVMCEGEPHLIDFGLARFFSESLPSLPERMESYPPAKQMARRIHPLSDLYALGHFLLFLFYSGYEHPEGAPERSWEEELTLPPAVRRMLRRLLELDPPYPGVDAFLADLDSYLHQDAIG